MLHRDLVHSGQRISMPFLNEGKPLLTFLISIGFFQCFGKTEGIHYM